MELKTCASRIYTLRTSNTKNTRTHTQNQQVSCAIAAELNTYPTSFTLIGSVQGRVLTVIPDCRFRLSSQKDRKGPASRFLLSLAAVCNIQMYVTSAHCYSLKGKEYEYYCDI